MNANRNISLDLFRTFAMMAVVAIHLHSVWHKKLMTGFSSADGVIKN